MIVLDYETRSQCDLTVAGAYTYAKNPSTDILCVALYDMVDDVKIVFDPCAEEMPDEWVERLNNADYVAAVNATFDLLIHENVGVPVYGFPVIELERWYCASAQFRVNALPANLEDAALAAKVANLKDPKGKQLIKALSIPQEDGTFNEDPGLMHEMGDYCLKDALATVDLIRATRMLTPAEHRDWLICERMNRKGVKIDRTLAKLATEYADDEQGEIAGKLTALTNGVITKPTQHQRIKKYVMDAIGDSTDENDRKLAKLMTVYKKKEKKLSLAKDVRESILEAINNQSLNIYEDLEELVRLLDAASASSVAKFRKMLELADPIDDRVRGAFIHAGASQTHRFSSKGLQLHNMRRECFDSEQTERIRSYMEVGLDIDNVMQTLSKLLRPALIPAKGHKFVVGDWSAIEGRGLPWLSGSPEGEKKLDQYRAGLDTYIEAAKGIYNKNDIHKESTERQVGKVCELSLQFGGATGAFNNMAKNYGVILPDHQVERIVKNWRKANPWAVKLWRDLENAAKKAIRARGERSFKAGRVTYHFIPNMLGGTLVCELPGDTFIQYPFARIEHSNKGDNIVALKASIKPKADEKEKHWGEVRLWGGLLAENIAQAFCATLLRNVPAESKVIANYLVAHVHDEIVLEVPIAKAKTLKRVLQEGMELVPQFAKGLPLKAEPVILDRYGNH